MPKISVIIPLHNDEKFIQDTIYCLRAQTFQSFECIIVDDCSTDNSVNRAISAIEGDSRFLIVKNKKNSKLPATRNIGLLYSSGEYILFLDSDDIISTRCLTERYTTVINNKYKNVAGSYSQYKSIPEDTNKYEDSSNIKLPIVSFESSLGDNPFVIHSTLTRRDIVCGIGGFDEEYSYGAEDFDFWLRILRHGFIFIPTNTLNAFYRTKNNSMVRRDARHHLKAALYIQNKNNSIIPKNSFFSIAEVAMNKPAWAYAVEKKYLNRICRFSGMLIAQNVDPDVTYIAKYIPSFYEWTPGDMSPINLIRAGIQRANPQSKESQFISRYDKNIAELISNLNSETKNNTQLYQDKSMDIYSAEWQRNIDFIFIPHKDYHVETIKLLSPYLEDKGYNYVVADITALYRDEGVEQSLKDSHIPHIRLAKICFGDFSPKCIVVFNDWDKLITRPAMEAALKTGIVALAIVEGIQDYNDADTGRIRNPYRTCSHLILPCSHDLKYFEGSDQYIYNGGIPRIAELSKNSYLHKYDKNNPIVINSNFTYGVLTEERDNWVKLAVEACLELGFDYIISKHPADEGDFSQYKVSDKTMYDTIWHGSLFISRFGSGIIESLAMERPVIYFNPHNEQVDKFKNPLGAYYIATTKDELKEKILQTFSDLAVLKQSWPLFLETHAGCAKDNMDSPIQRVYKGLEQALASIPLPSQEKRKLFGEYFSSYFHRSDEQIFKNIKVIKELDKLKSSKNIENNIHKNNTIKPAVKQHAHSKFKQKIKKLVNNPYLFFHDSKKIFHYFKYFFILKNKK